MLNTKQTQQSVILFFLFLVMASFIPLQNLKADEFDPDQYLNDPKIRAEVRKINSNTLAKQTFMDNANRFGITNSLLGFINNLGGAQYVKQIEMIQDVPIAKWKSLVGGRSQIVSVRKIVTRNRPVVVTSRLATIGSNVANALGVLSVGIDIADAIKGDDSAKLKAIAGMENLVRGHLISTYGGAGMNIAMASTAILGYALSTFINTTFSEYSEDWWIKYSGYLLEKYPEVIGGENSWYGLSITPNGIEAINGRLYEYWDTQALDDQTQNLQHSSYAQNQYGASFAARYYKDYLHTTLKTKYRLEAEKVEANAFFTAQKRLKELNEFIEDIKALKAAIEAADQLIKIDKITIDPIKVNLTIGQKQTFKVNAINKAGVKEDVSFHALQPSVEFKAERLGTFYMEAKYEGKKAKATIIVYDPEAGDGAKEDVRQEEPEEDEDEEAGDCSNEYIEQLVDLTELSIMYWKEDETELLSYINKFNKEINDQASDPCRNSTISYSYSHASELAREMDQNKSEIIDAVADILVYNTVCVDLNQLLEGGGVPVIDLISRSNDLKSYQEEINEMTMRLLENGCDEQEVAEVGEKAVPPDEDPGFVQDGGTSVTDNGYNPGGGTGTAEEIYYQCLQSKGINPNNIESDIQNLLNVWIDAQAAYYDGNNTDPYKCSNYKKTLNDLLDYYIAMRDCYIEAGYSDPRILQGLQTSIDLYSTEIYNLQC